MREELFLLKELNLKGGLIPRARLFHPQILDRPAVGEKVGRENSPPVIPEVRFQDDGPASVSEKNSHVPSLI
jgi:hypothetical protein